IEEHREAVPASATIGALEDTPFSPCIEGRRMGGVYGQGSDEFIRQARVNGRPASATVGALEDAAASTPRIEGGRIRRVNGQCLDSSAFRPVAGPYLRRRNASQR